MATPRQQHPEWAVDAIIDERGTQRPHGIRYRVKWLHAGSPTTWKPAANLEGSFALDRWLSHPGPCNYTLAIRGEPGLLGAVTSLPNIPASML